MTLMTLIMTSLLHPSPCPRHALVSDHCRGASQVPISELPPDSSELSLTEEISSAVITPHS